MQAEEEDPLYESVTFSKNANLGRWTNFVNLGDMCGVSVFSGLLRPGTGESYILLCAPVQCAVAVRQLCNAAAP